MKYLLSGMLMLSVLASSGQQMKATSTNEFIMECMKVNEAGRNRQMVLWFPYNFWQLVGEQMKISPEFTQQIVDEMSNYMMFAVVDYTISGSGLSFKPADEIRKSLQMFDSSKNAHKPIEDKDISPTAAQLIKNLHPTMAQMLGQFGAGMRIFLFDAKKVNGKPVVDISKPNHFRLSWDQASVRWTLPFASVLPPKSCPVDNEPMKGNWYYCPVHGVKLDK